MKPIIFSTPMVQAILAGRKTQTRRVMKPQPVLRNGLWEWHTGGWSDGCNPVFMPCHGMYNRMPVKPGDILWVRETVTRIESGWWYKTEGIPSEPWGRLRDTCTWVPAIHMPLTAARIFLRVTDVRAERVQEISTEDALAEGCEHLAANVDARDDYIMLWNDLNTKRGYSWDSNPWVWAYTFERVEKPEVRP